MKIKKPYLLDTENMLAWYQTEQEAIECFEAYCSFYTLRIKEFGTRVITVTNICNNKILFSKSIS